MDHTAHMKDQENEAFGQFLIQAIADSIGMEPDPRLIDRAVYKGTDFGAWVRFDSQGIIVGTIVEGSNAEYATRISLEGIQEDEEGAKLLCKRFWEALQECEDFAYEKWATRK